ncbi:hypothetical protein PoB_000336300 [Plakobranchus ocellatus]|uniref:Uncharacterized protein n=1 Tax=Plakobranchus ocellatus TaxID=259542 RepID=A0AAV3Y3F4_9GAST|nr:hypothetical protein PoB_000336300 [Plakobranchus ocellatus]
MATIARKYSYWGVNPLTVQTPDSLFTIPGGSSPFHSLLDCTGSHNYRVGFLCRDHPQKVISGFQALRRVRAPVAGRLNLRQRCLFKSQSGLAIHYAYNY